MQAKLIGPCTLYEHRWHFDQYSGRCLSFEFGGCHGNRNNFETEVDCRATCGGEVKMVENNMLPVTELSAPVSITGRGYC